MFLKNKNIIFKIRRSKVTDYAALNVRKELTSSSTMYMNMRKMKDLISLSIGMDQTIIYRPPDKSVYLKIILLIPQSKYMWILKRKSAIRQFF